MAKAKKIIRKPSKKRADKYETKLKVNGSADDIFNAMLKSKQTAKKK